MRHAPKLWSRRQTRVVVCAVASAATLYNFKVEVADVDRGAYASLELRVARHPSETPEYMLARLLAYCLEYQEGIAFTDGVSAVDEPAVLVRDLTGRITAWIEVGAPSACIAAPSWPRAAPSTRTATRRRCSPSTPARASIAPSTSPSSASGAAIWRPSRPRFRGAACCRCRAPKGSCIWRSMA